MESFFLGPLSCHPAPASKVTDTNSFWTCTVFFFFSLLTPNAGESAVCILTLALLLARINPQKAVSVSKFCALVKCQPWEEMLLILLRAQRTPRSALACLIHVFKMLPLSFRESRDGDTERKCDLLFIISTISSAKHDFFSSYYTEHENKMFSKRPGFGCREEGQGLVQNSEGIDEQMIPIFF